MNAANETILHIDLNKLEQNFNYLKGCLTDKSGENISGKRFKSF